MYFITIHLDFSKISFFSRNLLQFENFKIYLILGVVKRNPLFLHEIEWKNNGFLFTTPNIKIYSIFNVKYNHV